MDLCIAIEDVYIHLGCCRNNQCLRIKSVYLRSLRSPLPTCTIFYAFLSLLGAPPIYSVCTLEWPPMILVVPGVVLTEFRSVHMYKASFFPQE